VTNKIRRSDTAEFLNLFSMGTKREIVGMPIDFIGEPQAWEAVVLPLNYARARRLAPTPQDNAKGGRGKAGTASALALRRACFTLATISDHVSVGRICVLARLTECRRIGICMRDLQDFATEETTR
jgi:hypothetical protein